MLSSAPTVHRHAGFSHSSHKTGTIRLTLILFSLASLLAAYSNAASPTEQRASLRAESRTESQAASTSITLKEAYRSALSRTETRPLGQSRINQADARVEQAKSRFLPSLSLGASLQEQDDSVKASRQSSYTRVTLSQSLYEGGRDRSTVEARKAEREVERQNLSVADYDLFTTVSRSFYAILSGQQEVDNLQKTINLAADRVKEITSRAKIGRSRKVDLMAAQAQLSVLQAQLMEANGLLITAKDRFVLLTGIPRDVKLVRKKETPAAPKDLQEYLDLLERRPDIAAFKARTESEKSDINAAKAGHLPSISLNGNYYLTRSGSQKDDRWDVGAALSFPIFSGGIVSAQVREASERASEGELLLSQARRQAEISIRTAYNSLISALNQIKALESALRSTEDNYKEQEKDYRFGQATNLDVIQALNSFQDTKRTLDRTHFSALSAWAELKAATAQVSLANTGDES